MLESGWNSLDQRWLERLELEGDSYLRTRNDQPHFQFQESV